MGICGAFAAMSPTTVRPPDMTTKERLVKSTFAIALARLVLAASRPVMPGLCSSEVGGMNWRALGLAVCIVVAACGGGGASAGNPSPSAQGIPFALHAVHNSGVSGDGTITKMAGKFTVTVRLTGLAAKSSHMSHIHKGSCANEGDVVITLEDVTANGTGAGTASTTISHPYVVPSTGWYVNVHAGPDLSKAEYAESIACGDLT